MAREIEDILHERGYRLTPQRQLVLGALEGEAQHLSAEEIHEEGRRSHPHLSISTVYRTLELLKGLGLVTETDLGEGRVKYHLADKGHHHHLVCQQCGQVLELGEDFLSPIGEALKAHYGFQADLNHFAIFGRCARCAA